MAEVVAAVVHTMPAEPFRGKQRRHFLFAVLLPSALTVALPLLPLPLFSHAAWAAGLLLLMWFLVGGVGVSVGLHRLFSHRSFETGPRLRWLLGALGSMAAQGPVVYWVSLHRLHHASSDRIGDPHSPQPRAWAAAGGRDLETAPGRWWSFWQGHWGWVPNHDVPKPTRYARELIGDPVVRALGRQYPLYVAAGVALPAAVALLALGSSLGTWQAVLFGAYWGGVVRIALGHHIIWAINSWCHWRGSRPHAVADDSCNVAWLALLSWGESWHNNHHAAPVSARFGTGWRQPDVGWWVVRGLCALRLAKVRSAG